PAMAARTAFRVPFLFDTRGMWIDERIEDGRWFTNPAALRAGRALERRLFRAASGVVTLTELEAGDVRAGDYGDAARGRPITAIPTCADYEEFRIQRPEEWRHVPAELARRLKGRLVLSFVGAMNAA